MQKKACRLALIARVAAVAALAVTAIWAPSARAADHLLAGSVVSSSGEALGGVTVSAQRLDSNITTSVFTDEHGNYYFPAMPSGRYRVWAQAVTFGTAKAEVKLTATGHQNFTLKPLADFVPQLTGDVMIASLPEDTPEDVRLKQIVRNNCTGCHTPNYPLQHKFDEKGWTAIIDLMKHVNVLGTYQGPKHKPNGILEFHD
jgi:hypothetical protein